MFEELNDAREDLDRALDRYLKACAIVQNCAEQPFFHHTQENSTRMANEIISITGQEKKIHAAKKYISQAINNSPFVSQINRLPDEILGRVFQMSLGVFSSFTFTREAQKRAPFAQITECLSRVCTRWRQLAIGLPTLWQHIDFNMSLVDDASVLAHANARMTRAGQLPLDIHIRGSLVNTEELERWMISAAPRIKSLTLILSSTPFFDTSREPILAACFKHCSPGIFEHLTIWKEYSVWSEETIPVLNLEGLSNTDSEFESIYQQITSLRLCQIHPPWTNRIYCGLSELHIGSSYSDDSPYLSIPAPQLATILQSSPKLRVLRLDLVMVVYESTLEGLPIPVRLDDLEILDLSTECRYVDRTRLECLLHFVAPGNKPLQLMVDDLEEDDLLLQGGVQAFFTRSNVTRLKLVNPGRVIKEPDVSILPHLAPQLQILILKQYSWGQDLFDPTTLQLSSGLRNDDDSTSTFHPNYLHLDHCDVQLDAYLEFLRNLANPPQTLIFGNCRIMRGKSHVYKEEAHNAFQNVSQNVKILDNHPLPPDGWLFDGMPPLY